MRSAIFLTFLLTVSLHCAQGQTYHQSLYWLRYQVQFVFNPKWSVNADVDNRRFFNPDVENQLIFHSRLHYRHKHWDFGGGLTYSVAFAAIPERGYDNSVDELRPVVEASYERRIGNVHIANRLRMDNRIFQEDPDQSVFSESFYVMRLRYRLQGRMALKKNDEGVTMIGLRVADEIMVNDRKNFFDQNRIYITGEFYLNKRFSTSAEYIWIYQQRFGRDEFFSRNVFRLSFIHKIDL